MSYPALVPVGHTRRGVSKASFVYEDLRAGIVGLHLKPGIRVDKTAICARLGVSRQPLAEAIARLAEERLVDVEPQKGTFVARIRLSDVTEAAFVRRTLETAMVEAIAPTMDAPKLGRLERILGYQVAALRAKDVEEFHALDLRFHRALFDCLGMSRVAEVVDAFRAQLERARRVLLPTATRRHNTLREHRAILVGLAERNPAKAVAAMAAHLDEGMAELKRFATRAPDLFEP